MSKKISKEMEAAMQLDRDAGMTIRAIAEKYGVCTATVSERTYAREGDWVDPIKARWPEWDEWDILHERYGKGGRE